MDDTFKTDKCIFFDIWFDPEKEKYVIGCNDKFSEINDKDVWLYRGFMAKDVDIFHLFHAVLTLPYPKKQKIGPYITNDKS